MTSTGATITQIPSKMDFMLKSDSRNSVHLSWPELRGAETGGRPIQRYNIYQGRDDGPMDTKIMSNLTTSFKAENLTKGFSYRFRIQGENSCGFGPYSDIVQITPPDQIKKVTINSTTEGCSAHITWEKPLNGGLNITGYKIQVGKNIDCE